jgi:hypothetical protein
VPKSDCAAFIAAAEAWAARDGWTTARHYSVPTTDVPLLSLPSVLPSFHRALHAKLLPALSSRYPAAAPDPSKLRVLDCFLVKWTPTHSTSP